ncbi:MAG: efflux transporter outer membrane subunit [Proteobacteria bacterium]|nr:efflux transporter outer membrane subunit [Pseudomonadota bacterium]
MRNFAAALLATSFLTACAVGPDYARPETTTTATFQRKAANVSAAEPAGTFWTRFNDPLLTRLVDEALQRNTDLRVAVARLDQARALSFQSALDLLPTVTGEGGFTTTRTPASRTLPGAGRDSDSYDAGLNAAWEIDLFGRVRRGVEADRAEAQAVAADLRGVQVSVVSEVVKSYFELRGRQEQLSVARRNADNQRDTLKLTETRLEAGRGTDFDTARARAQLKLTESRIPQLETAVAAAAHRLAVLTGREPGALKTDLAVPAPLAVLPQDVAVGTPAELLRRRPDIQAAERRLASATARVGVATADLFPRLTLGGTLSSVSPTLGGLFSASSESYAAGPLVSWAFLDLGRVKARIDASDANARASLATYEGTVLKALEESENALIAYDRTRLEAEHLEQAAAAGREGARLARVRFENGIADFLPVLDAERAQLEAEDRLAETRTRAATSLVAVYKAVAGGWPDRVVQNETGG